MIIELVEVTEDYLPPENGKYLVRTKSTGPLQTVHFFGANVTLTYNDKKKKWMFSVDVSNQVVTHISVQPLQLYDEKESIPQGENH